MKILLFIVSFSLSFGAMAQTSNIVNFHSFGSSLYRGARPTPQDLTSLQQLGVKTVINLQGGDLNNPDFRWLVAQMEPSEAPQMIQQEKMNVQNLGMNFVNVPLDSLSPVSYQEAQQIGALIKFMNDPQNKPIFIHCEHGADRTGLVVALFRVYFQQWTAQKAYDEMASLGHDTLHSLVTYDLDNFYWQATKGH